MNSTILSRFEARYTVADNDCWLWHGCRNLKGYGTYRFGGWTHLAHRLAYEHHVGPIAEGLTLDHLCRTRNCVNPAHLEPVTGAENVLRGQSFAAQNARKTHCPKGHPYDEANTYRAPGTPNWRKCRTCLGLRLAA